MAYFHGNKMYSNGYNLIFFCNEYDNAVHELFDCMLWFAFATACWALWFTATIVEGVD